MVTSLSCPLKASPSSHTPIHKLFTLVLVGGRSEEGEKILRVPVQHRPTASIQTLSVSFQVMMNKLCRRWQGQGRGRLSLREQRTKAQRGKKPRERFVRINQKEATVREEVVMRSQDHRRR